MSSCATRHSPNFSVTTDFACKGIYGSYQYSMPMVWNERKRERNMLAPPAGHGFDFADARDGFEWDTAMILPTYPSKRGGERWMAVGFLNGELVALIFSLLGTEAVSAISLRIASNRERKAYVSQTQ